MTAPGHRQRRVEPPRHLTRIDDVACAALDDPRVWRAYQDGVRKGLRGDAARLGCRVVSGRATVRIAAARFLEGGRQVTVQWRVQLRPLTVAERAGIESGPDMAGRMALWPQDELDAAIADGSRL